MKVKKIKTNLNNWSIRAIGVYGLLIIPEIQGKNRLFSQTICGGDEKEKN